MLKIPRAPLILGLAGLLPFIAGATVSAGAFNVNMGDPSNGGYPLIVADDGTELLILYGTIILSFMSGVLWGFAARAEGPISTTGYVLSVLPALWALFFRGGTASDTIFYLMIGFIGLLGLDWIFSQQGLTPDWWMRLRILLTTIVVICLAIGTYA